MRFPWIGCALALTVMAGTAGAVELPQNKPNPDRAALEQMLNSQRDLPPDQIKGFVHIPDEKAGVLIQPDGRTFRDVRTRWQPYITGGLRSHHKVTTLPQRILMSNFNGIISHRLLYDGS